ncbi:MAG: hypothetical protein ACLPOA_11930 [Methylocella sp.]
MSVRHAAALARKPLNVQAVKVLVSTILGKVVSRRRAGDASNKRDNAPEEPDAAQAHQDERAA